MKIQALVWAAAASLALALAGCGGGGGAGSVAAVPPPVAAGTTSTGAITAFGSVFVNGHEFSTLNALLIDDDTGSTAASTAALEVGMVVDVKHASGSSSASPLASELHVHPLARGFVDASSVAAGTLTVMGQTVQLTTATNFSDHRACVSAATNPCNAITSQSELTASSGSGAGASAGSYVTVHGYLFGTAPGAVNIVATLVSVADVAPSSAGGVQFKAEGVVNATSATGVTIGALNVDLSKASCRVGGAKTNCAGAFSIGQVVSAMASSAPALPAVTLVADVARLSAKIAVETNGTVVEIEGGVSSVSSAPASFVVRGISVDASGLPAGTALPGVGDIVRVVGTVSGAGQSVSATSVTVLNAAAATAVGLQGDASAVLAGASSNTYAVTVLGQSVQVAAATRLSDHSIRTWAAKDPASNPFNITTFQSYMAASKSQHLLISAQADALGKLTALSLTIVPASAVSGVAGVVDATPVPVNSTVTGTPSTFSVHGLAVSADPAAIFRLRGKAASTVAAGDEVVVLGSFAAATLTVKATPSLTNQVLDLGPPTRRNRGGF